MAQFRRECFFNLDRWLFHRCLNYPFKKKIISVVISTMETNQANKERTDFIGFFAEIVHILEMKINICLKCMCVFLCLVLELICHFVGYFTRRVICMVTGSFGSVNVLINFIGSNSVAFSPLQSKWCMITYSCLLHVQLILWSICWIARYVKLEHERKKQHYQ